MQVPIKDLKGAQVDTIDLNETVFGLPMNRSLVYQALMVQRANARQGNADTKTRSEVSGSGKKPWAQKHTGRARAGDKRSPLWRHGGIVFGPHPHSFEQALPKKMRRLAIRCMLSDKQRNSELVVLRDLALESGKTKAMVELLQALDVMGTVLVVTAQSDENVVRAGSNIGRVWTLPVSVLSVGDLVKYKHLVMTVDAVKEAERLWAAAPSRKLSERMGGQA